MNFSDLAKERYSVRKFAPLAVEKEKIVKILEAGRIAPTACNNQPQKIYVMQSKESLEKLQNCKFSHFGETLAFLICYDRNICWNRKCDGKASGDIDAAIVSTHMMLQACELGIGSTWVMNFLPDVVREEFSLPESEEPVSLLVMGYAAEDAKPYENHEKKKLIEDIAQYI